MPNPKYSSWYRSDSIIPVTQSPASAGGGRTAAVTEAPEGSYAWAVMIPATPATHGGAESRIDPLICCAVIGGVACAIQRLLFRVTASKSSITVSRLAWHVPRTPQLPPA